MTLALVIVDAQYDFFEGGSLAVPQSLNIIDPINNLIKSFQRHSHPIAATKDWHPANTAHFNDWPSHCVQGTPGAEIHAGIEDWERTVQVFLKGRESLKPGEADTSYSGALAITSILNHEVSLPEWLTMYGILHVYLCGLALDYCVRATALDLRKAGFGATVVLDATKPVDPATGYEALEEMLDAGVQFTTSSTF